MGNPEPPDPDEESARRRRQRDTEPIPRLQPEQDPGYGTDPSYSDETSYRTVYGADPGGTRQVHEEPVITYAPPDISADELAGLQIDSSGNIVRPRRVLPLEDEPTALVARYLFPTERFRGEWKRHWIHLAIPLLIGVFATFVLGYLSGYLASQEVAGLTTAVVLIWLVVLGWVAWRITDWYFDRFILTNKRVMVVNGIVTRKVGMMPLQRVTDMKYEQSPLARFLNYGTFVLESAGQDQALREIKHLPNPNELYLRVVEEMYEPHAVEARLGKEQAQQKKEEQEDGA
ncbi:PH domain-containing protein [Micromonospora pattaloongensis]|uniref:PH domain-containing protein n=1 Tax=Micromonospora pattaloongensis TaxID=405436 RepID=A0A1H3GMZ3_9ACTN|nr:PH domain-containing protein [Micromonospora pattaloongensis]SDY04693.1 PH domain-containing protein [Micromonospora pattaloongensis]